jgi:hypothetical protein
MKLLNKKVFFILAFLSSFTIKAQAPWEKTINPSLANSNYLTDYKFIETTDKGILVLFSARKFMVLIKLNSSGELLFKKHIYINRTADNSLVAGGLVEDLDHGIIISGILVNNAFTKAFRLKLNPCYELDYFVYSDKDCDGGSFGPILQKNTLIEANLVFDFDLFNSSLKLNSINRADNKLIKSQFFFNTNNPDIKQILPKENGAYIVGSAYFDCPWPVPNINCLHSYFLDIDSNLALIKSYVFDKGITYPTIGNSIANYNNKIYLFNACKDTIANTGRYNHEMVKVSEDYSKVERFRLNDQREMNGGKMQAIDENIYTCLSFYNDSTLKESSALIAGFNTNNDSFFTQTIDTIRNLNAVDLIKTYDKKLLFIYSQKYPTTVNPSFVLFKYKSNLEPDTFLIQDTFIYDKTCLTSINTQDLTINIDSLFMSNSEINEQLNFLDISPNPASGSVKISFPIAQIKPAKLSIISLNGKIVLENLLTENESIIQIENLTPGVYFVQLKSENSAYIKKLFVK